MKKNIFILFLLIVLFIGCEKKEPRPYDFPDPCADNPTDCRSL